MKHDIRNELQKFKNDVEKTAEAMGQSTVVMSLFTKNFGDDVQSLVQLALSIMLDKPLLLLVPHGRTVPIKLRQFADDIEFYDENSREDAFRATEALLERNKRH